MKPFQRALLYRPQTGESEGTINHGGKVLRFAKPTLGNKIKAFVAGEKFVANRPPPPAHLTPHALSRSLAPIQNHFRSKGVQFRSGLGPVAGVHEFSHVVTSPHNSAAATVHELHRTLGATHKVTKPVWGGKSWGFTATAKDGTRHHIEGAENAHVRDVHNSFAHFGQVRVKTGQARHPRTKEHLYTHNVQTAVPDAAKQVFADHFKQRGYSVRKTAAGLHLTHGVTGVKHQLTFAKAPGLPQQQSSAQAQAAMPVQPKRRKAA